MIDLLDQLPTRRFFRPLLVDKHIVVRCKGSKVAQLPEVLSKNLLTSPNISLKTCLLTYLLAFLTCLFLYVSLSSKEVHMPVIWSLKHCIFSSFSHLY